METCFCEGILCWTIPGNGSIAHSCYIFKLNFLAYQIVIILAKTRYLFCGMRRCSDLRYKQHSYKNTGGRSKATAKNWDQNHLQIIDPSMANQLAKCILDSVKKISEYLLCETKERRCTETGLLAYEFQELTI